MGRQTRFPVMAACLAGALSAALPLPAAAQNAGPGIVNQPNASSGGVIPETPTVAPYLRREPPQPLPIPQSSPSRASAPCQMPADTRSADLNAYCRARGE